MQLKINAMLTSWDQNCLVRRRVRFRSGKHNRKLLKNNGKWFVFARHEKKLPLLWFCWLRVLETRDEFKLLHLKDCEKLKITLSFFWIKSMVSKDIQYYIMMDFLEEVPPWGFQREANKSWKKQLINTMLSMKTSELSPINRLPCVGSVEFQLVLQIADSSLKRSVQIRCQGFLN